MAIHRDITRNDNVFTGEDKPFVFTIYEADDVTPIDINGWSLSWMLKRNQLDVDANALITKSTALGSILITGTWNVNPATNSQRASLTLTDNELATISSRITYYHELKRVDANQETVLTWGTFSLRQAVHR